VFFRQGCAAEELEPVLINAMGRPDDWNGAVPLHVGMCRKPRRAAAREGRDLSRVSYGLFCDQRATLGLRISLPFRSTCRSGSGEYAPVLPRNELTPAPHAVYSQKAGSVPGGITGSGTPVAADSPTSVRRGSLPVALARGCPGVGTDPFLAGRKPGILTLLTESLLEPGEVRQVHVAFPCALQVSGGAATITAHL